jgi:predicted metal-binding protein
MDWLKAAYDAGFTAAGWLDVGRLDFSDAQKLRGFCRDNVCGSYNVDWTCPPAVGEPELCVSKVRRFKRALVVQYEETLDDFSNKDEIVRVRSNFKRLMRGFLPVVRGSYPEVLALGAGGCGLCDKCTYPESPCRNPDKMVQSLSAFCVNAQRACDIVGMTCWRKGFLAFTGLFLIDKRRVQKLV